MILYVSKLFGDGDFGADQHYRAIREIYGDDNVFTVDISPNDSYRKDRYVAFGKCKSPVHRICRWFQGNMQYISSGIIAEILEIISENSITDVFIEDSVFGNLVYRIKKEFPDVRVICFYHDIKYVLYKKWSKKLPLYNKIELQIGRMQEKLSQRYSDVELVLNEREAELYRQVYGKTPDDIVLLSAPDPYQSGEKSGNNTDNEMDHKAHIQNLSHGQSETEIETGLNVESKVKSDQEKVILFVGKNYYPNLEGLRWFLERVMPSINGKFRLWIVGRGLEFLKEEIKDPRVAVIGGVESLDEYYHKADLVITPLFEGGGMKLKTLEALSYGKRIAGTKESFIGVWERIPDDMKQDNLFSSEDNDDWVRWINSELIKDSEKFDEKVYGFYRKNFSYEVMRDKLEKILKS